MPLARQDAPGYTQNRRHIIGCRVHKEKMELIKFVIDFICALSLSEIISYVIALIGTGIGLLSYYRSKIVQKPRFKKMSAVITEDMISKNSAVHIQNGDQRLSQLTISTIALWNDGITLKREDISAKSPFRVELCQEDSEILDCFLSYSEKENDVTLQIAEDRKSIILDFDYLAKKQGFVLKTLHTGQGSKALNVDGAMKNEGKITKSEPLHVKINKFVSKHLSLSKQDTFFGYLFCVLGLLCIFWSIIRYGTSIDAHIVGWNETLVDVILGLILFIFGCLNLRDRMPSKISKAFYEGL